MPRSPSKTVMHGELPPPGVWSFEGFGRRGASYPSRSLHHRVSHLASPPVVSADHTNMSFNKHLIPKHDTALVSADFLYANTFYSNGLVDMGPIHSKDLHLGYDLVPLAPPPGAAPPRMGNTHAARSPPGRRLSAIEFDDGAWAEATNVTPKRVPVGGAWRLTSSISSPDLAASPGKVARKVYPQHERNVQRDNRELRETRASSSTAQRWRQIEEEKAALASWPRRWGFEGTANSTENGKGLFIPIRKRGPPEDHFSSRPTLPGCDGLDHRS